MFKAIRISIVVLSSLCLLACASKKDIIIDQNGVDMSAYQADLAECAVIAEQAGRGQAVKGAAAGAAMGGAVGAIRGDSDQAKEDAGVGAVFGAAGGAREKRKERLKVQKNCLRNRGYQVLN